MSIRFVQKGPAPAVNPYYTAQDTSLELHKYVVFAWRWRDIVESEASSDERGGRVPAQFNDFKLGRYMAGVPVIICWFEVKTEVNEKTFPARRYGAGNVL